MRVNLGNDWSLNEDKNTNIVLTHKKLTYLIVFLFVSTDPYFYSQHKVEGKEREAALRVIDLINNFNLPAALKLSDSIQIIGEKNDDKNLLSTIYNMKGTIYREENKIKDAIFYFNKAIEINVGLNNAEGLGDNYVNLGSIYSFLEENKSALNYYFKAVAQFNKRKNDHGLSVLYNNIGNIYIKMKQFTNAEYYLNKALTVALSDKDALNTAMVYHNLANCMADEEKIDTAIKFYFLSLAQLKSLDEGIGHLYNYNRLANMYYKQKKLAQSEKYVKSALKIAQQGELIGDMSLAYYLLSAIYEDKGDLKNALKYNKLHLSMKDSLREEADRTDMIKIEFESELKNQKKQQDLVRQNQEAINKAKIESKNKDLILSYSALGFAGLMVVFMLYGYRQKQKANTIISKQKELVEHKNSEILSSINYAKRIQYALLAHKEFIEANLHQHFIYFHPKDIVSGDFYWAAKKGSRFYLGVCDSTGHGVPGAFMSLLNTGFLSEAINEKNILEPNIVLDHVRSRLIETISKDGQKDGFDGILICLDEKTNELTYAAANNAPILISNNALSELEKDRMPVGIGENETPFKLFTLRPKKGDTLILYTDGYADQFGGPKGKKFKYKQLNELLLKISVEKMEDQKNELERTFQNWRGELEQVDDVCLIGIRF